MTRPTDDLLDDLFARARGGETAPDDDLVARVLADAEAVQSTFAGAEPHAEPRSLWARMLDALGGWPAVSGLAAATVAGFWIGVAPPTPVAELTASVFGDTVSVPMVPTDLGFDTGAFADG